MLGWLELLSRGGELDCCFFGPPLPFSLLLLFVSAPVSLESRVSLILSYTMCSHVKLTNMTLLDDIWIVWGFVKSMADVLCNKRFGQLGMPGSCCMSQIWYNLPREEYQPYNQALSFHGWTGRSLSSAHL